MLSAEQLEKLARSKDFQTILRNDPHLAELEKARFDEAAEVFSLFEFLRSILRIGELPVQPITPAVWALLWASRNAFVRDMEHITETDTDVFLYVLANGVRRIGGTLSELPAKASGFTAKTGLDYAAAAGEIIQLINAAFRPLAMLPKVDSESSAAPFFDAYWLAQLLSVVAEETREKASDILFDMPLSTCFFYFVNAARKRDTKNSIFRRSDDEINREIVLYTEELGRKFLESESDHAIR